MSLPECPLPSQLHDYARGTLPEGLADTHANHLDHCPTCESLLNNLERQQIPLLASSGGQPPTTIGSDNAEYQHAVEIAEAAIQGLLAGEALPAASRRRGPLPLGPFDEFELLEELAVGDMGAVYKARQIRLDKVVALKVSSKGCTSDPRAVARFDREMKAVGRLSHPNIVQALDARDIGDTAVLVMEYVDGIDLSKLLRSAGPLKAADACELVRQAALGLQYAHEHGWVHRDIKPSNLMLSRQGCVKILDLGLALLKSEPLANVAGTHPVPSAPDSGFPEQLPIAECGQSRVADGTPTMQARCPVPATTSVELTSSGQTMGTADYVAPEQAEDSHNVDIRADIYSLGCTLYHLLACRAPYSGPNYQTRSAKMGGHLHDPAPPLGSLRPDIPPELSAVVERMMAKEPAERFATPAEVAAALRFWVAGNDLIGLLAQVGIASTDWKPLEESDPDTPPDQSHKEVQTGPDYKKAQPPSALWYRRPLIQLVTALALTALLGVLIIISTRYGTVTIRTDDASLDVSSQAKDAHAPAPTPASESPPPRIVGWLDPSDKFGVAGMRVSPDGGTLYLIRGSANGPLAVVVMDIAAGKVLRTIRFPDRSYEHKGMAISPDGRYLYVTNYFRRDITRVDLRDDDKLVDLAIRHVPGAAWASYQIDVTPDGQKLVVATGQDVRSVDMDNDQLSIVDIAGGKFDLVGEVKLADEPKGFQLAIGSDGRSAYLVTLPRKSKTPMLYEVSLTPPYRVTRSLAFPDGDLQGVAAATTIHRIFVSDPGHRHVVVVDQDTFQPIANIKLEDYAPGTLTLTPRENLLAVICPENRRLFLVDPVTLSAVGQVDGFQAGAFSTRFSPDQRNAFIAHGAARQSVAMIDLGNLALRYRVVFASNRGGETFQLYSVDGDGRNVTRLTDNHATDLAPRWSPDGKQIAFISNREGLPKVCVLDSQSKTTTVLRGTDPVPAVPGNVALDWSPDGTELAFIGDQNRAIRIVTVASGKVRTLFEGDAGKGRTHHGKLCWSGGDSSIVFGSQNPSWGFDHAIFRLDPRTQKVTTLIDDNGQRELNYAPAVSPDGKQIAVVRRASDPAASTSRLWLLADNGASLRAAVGDVQGIINAPRWSPDGLHIAYSSQVGDHQHVYLARLEGGKSESLGAGEWDDVDPDVTDIQDAQTRTTSPHFK